jgi:hypothetical protein
LETRSLPGRSETAEEAPKPRHRSRRKAPARNLARRAAAPPHRPGATAAERRPTCPPAPGQGRVQWLDPRAAVGQTGSRVRGAHRRSRERTADQRDAPVSMRAERGTMSKTQVSSNSPHGSLPGGMAAWKDTRPTRSGTVQPLHRSRTRQPKPFPPRRRVQGRHWPHVLSRCQSEPRTAPTAKSRRLAAAVRCDAGPRGKGASRNTATWADAASRSG